MKKNTTQKTIKIAKNKERNKNTFGSLSGTEQTAQI
jgi:hypothetical protein